MYHVRATDTGLRLTVAASGPTTVLVDYDAGGRRHSVCKSSPTGVDVFDIPTMAPPSGWWTQTLTVDKAEKARTLYISRSVENAADIIAWFKAQGLSSTLTTDDMHVTIAFSRSPVIWEALPDHFPRIIVPTSLDRSVAHLGPKGTLVLKFWSELLVDRWSAVLNLGGSWDWPGYQAHITITYEGADIDPARLIPWFGKIVLGPEKFSEVKEDWSAKES